MILDIENDNHKLILYKYNKQNKLYITLLTYSIVASWCEPSKENVMTKILFLPEIDLIPQ